MSGRQMSLVNEEEDPERRGHDHHQPAFYNGFANARKDGGEYPGPRQRQDDNAPEDEKMFFRNVLRRRLGVERFRFLPGP